MKRGLLALALFAASAAWASPECERACAATVKECTTQCKKVMSKENPKMVGFCTNKCKEFEKECRKDCADEDKGKK